MHTVEEAYKNLDENFQQLTIREAELKSQREQMLTRLKKLADGIAKHKEELSRAKKELVEVSKKHQMSRLVAKIYPRLYV